MTNNIGQALTDAITNKDVVLTFSEICQYRDNMYSPDIGAKYVIWITEPANLSNIHKLLIDNLNIPPKLLAIRRSNMSRTQKGVLLMQAIEIAVKRVHNL